MSNFVGQSLGRYHIAEQLGEGGMAIVYKAYDTRLETDVAVKVIRTEKLTEETKENSLKRFEREAKSLARLTHPNIVKVTDYGEHEGKPYLVMPYLPGGTLKERMRSGPIPWQEAARILVPIADALAYAHQHELIHRDVKPSNILITENGKPMLSDFGVAKLLDPDQTMDLTGSGVGIGTPEYMAPEQVTSKHVDARADIYALGIVLYEMVTGRRPFTADTPMAVLFKHASEPLPRPAQFNPNLPETVEKILFKSLAKKPEDRYQEMSAFTRALEGLLESPTATQTIEEAPAPRRPAPERQPVSATATFVEPTRPPASSPRRGWMWVAGFALLGLFAVCVIGAYVLVTQLDLFAAASPTATKAPPTEKAPPTAMATSTTLPSLDLTQLVIAAQEEGTLNVIALPHDWCNYGEVIETFKAKYGLEVNEINPDAGSADEIEAIRANMGNNGTEAPDVVDIGIAYADSAKAEGLFSPYQVSTWDSITDNVKDAQGYWYGNYYGVMAFLINTEVQPNVPQDWADLLNPAYRGQVALNGDPRASNQAINAVYAAALANGGSLDDARPGLDFFAQLNRVGNLLPLIAINERVASGETPIRIGWDYLAFPAQDSFAGNPNTEVVYPATGRIASYYVQAISAYAPHPNAAKLWMEFLYSDEGQLLWMKGYCRPIREADMRARGVIPNDLLAKLPSIPGVQFPSAEQLAAAKAIITENWDAVVGADIR